MTSTPIVFSDIYSWSPRLHASQITMVCILAIIYSEPHLRATIFSNGACSIESEILEGKYCILPLFPNTRDGFWLEINECDECLDWKHSPDDGNSCRRQLFIVPSGMFHNSLAGYYTPSRLIYNLLCTHTATINCPLLYILMLSSFLRKTTESGQYMEAV